MTGPIFRATTPPQHQSPFGEHSSKALTHLAVAENPQNRNDSNPHQRGCRQQKTTTQRRKPSVMNSHENIDRFANHHLRKSAAPLSGTHPAVMNHLGHRHMADPIPGLAHTLAEINILSIHEKSRIEASNTSEERSSYQHAGPGNSMD
jgi:hypothetical protein